MTHPTPDSGDSFPTVHADPVGSDLRELFQLTAPTDPPSAEWDRVRLDVAGQLPRAGTIWRVAVAALAACVLLAIGVIVLTTGGKRGGPALVLVVDDSGQGEGTISVLPVAGDDEIEIETIRGGTWRVAVGEKPVSDVIEWAGPKDVWPWSSVPDDLFGFEPLMSGGFQDMPVFWPGDSQR